VMLLLVFVLYQPHSKAKSQIMACLILYTEK